MNAARWQPDPSGGRLVAIRAARRGALIASFLFGTLVVLAAVVASPGTDLQPALAGGLVAALLSLPGLALLGAGLTSAALGSRSSASSAGLAMGIGVPVAAVASAMIGSFMSVGLVVGADLGAEVAGTLLQAGVIAAVRISPLIALASIAWVLLVRRFGRTVGSSAVDHSP